LFGRAKTGGLGQVTTPPPKKNEKMGITRSCPDGGVKMRATTGFSEIIKHS